VTRWLVTGGAGFIGANFVRLLLSERPDAEVVNLDLLTYAGNLENLAGVEGDPRYRFVRGDVADPSSWDQHVPDAPDFVVHFAAESHVDRSIDDAHPFLRTNVLGTQSMLDWTRRRGVETFVQVGTDEVYGTLGPDDPKFVETSPIRPNSPYAASKASADLLVRAAAETHGLRTIITRCSNNYGPYQFPEKLLPLMITNAMEDRPLPVYGDGLQVRDWIHVEDHCRGVLAAAEAGEPGMVYNFGADGEQTNLSMVERVLALLDKPRSLIRHVEDRKGHDRRYAMGFAYAHEKLGWEPRVSLEQGLADTVAWYRGNEDWWRRVKSGAYRDYYDRMYAARLGGDESDD
jgi:dTDP-glucose 4,6-dehydratase